MQPLKYSCRKKKLHPDLQKVWREQKPNKDAEVFQQKENRFSSIKFIFFVLLSVAYIPHYTIMGLLGYETFLLNKKQIAHILGKRKYKTLLDIWSGSGCITREFESFVDTISYQEPSTSFQKILNRRGYRRDTDNAKTKYDIITLFNILDVCDNPQELVGKTIQKLHKEWVILISLPFPIWIKSWDNTHILETNTLAQAQDWDFESSVSSFYTDFLQKHNLRVTYFSRLPYIVSLPESKKTTVYDNGLFVCEAT